MRVVVTGSGTDIGKTWFTARTIEALRARGVTVAARKPVQSFDPADRHPRDADVLAAATGEDAAVVSPPHRCYAIAMAPPMAAQHLGAPPFTIADLAAEIGAGGERAEVLFVEGAGGARSPLAFDGDTVDLCAALDPSLVVVVADAGLGTINAVRLTAAALTSWRTIVALNRYDDTDELHRANAVWLREHDGFELVTTPTDLAAVLRR